MATKYILGGLAIVFLALAIFRGGPANPQRRTWFIIGIIFAAVSVWLFSQG